MRVPVPLSVEADLTVTAGGDTIRLIGQGRLLIVEAQTARAVLRLSRLLASSGGNRDRLGQLRTVLRAVDLRAEVRVRGRTVARIDPESRTGGLFRYGPMRLHPMRLLWSWLTDGRKVPGADR